MAVSCPVPSRSMMPVQHQVAQVFTILYPIYLLGCWLFFVYHRTSSVFLRRRSMAMVTAACFGSLVSWAATLLYDVLTPSRYPCALYGALYYLLIPATGTPIMLQSHIYLNEVSKQALALNGESIEGAANWATFSAHMRVALLNDRSKDTRLLNSQFRRTKSFFVLWIMITTFPYIFVYLIRLLTSPVWLAGCYGCAISKIDLICLLVVNISNAILGALMYSNRVRKGDSLRIMRQSFMAITVTLPVTIIVYVLALIDPGNAMANGSFNYASLILTCTTYAVYIMTVHQVLVSRAIKTKILLSDNIDRGDRLDDVLADKELFQDLESYLLSELSTEITGFLQAVPRVKTAFQNSREEGEAEAREVFATYLEKNKAKQEVNLPHTIRERVAASIKSGNFDATVFDEAYADVRANFLRDGFPRFLRWLKTKPPGSKNRKTNYYRANSRVTMVSSNPKSSVVSVGNSDNV